MQPIEIEEFENRIEMGRKDFLPALWNIEVVAGLRELSHIDHIMLMKQDYLERLFRSVTLMGQPSVRPYEHSRFAMRRMDPRGMRVGQTFVERSKLLNFLENFDSSMRGYCVTSGIAKLTPFIAFGVTGEGIPAIAHYLPPIIELHDKFRGHGVLIDGTHRNYSVMKIGTTIESINIYDVSCPLPCTPVQWEDVSAVDAKPAKEDRFKDFKPELFRDFKRIGIDG